MSTVLNTVIPHYSKTEFPFLMQYELGVGKYPYKLFANYYEQVAVVVDADAPRIPEDKEFSDSFRDFVHKWYVQHTCVSACTCLFVGVSVT